MIITTLTIGERRFRLTQTADLLVLEDELVTAVRAGGGIVPIPASGSQSVRALVTPGLPVLFESSEESEPGIPHFEDDISYESYLNDFPLDL